MLDCCEAVMRRDMAKAKLSCLEKYFNCFEKNHCQEEKYKYRKKFCIKIYAECIEFAKSMFKRIDANDFTPSRFLFKD